MTTTSSDGLRATVVLAGLHGHGRSHLAAVEALSRRSGIRLAGVCDPVPPSAEDAARLRDVVVTTRLDDLLDEVRPDVTIICTPIHTHAELARQALARGSHLLLEKPPTPTYDDFEALLADVRAFVERYPEVARMFAGSSLGLHAGMNLVGEVDVAWFSEQVLDLDAPRMSFRSSREVVRPDGWQRLPGSGFTFMVPFGPGQ